MTIETSSWVGEMAAQGHRILQFWREHVVLPDGSFHGRIARGGVIDAGAPRSLVIATRILWTFSRAVNSGFADTAEHRLIADRTYTYLTRHYWDVEHGGFYWSLGPDDRPLDESKHVYGQAFALFALAEYYAVTRRDDVLEMAQATYTLLEDKAADQEHEGYLEAFSRQWEWDSQCVRQGINHDGLPKSMNTHLHMLEAYTRFYEVWPNDQLKSLLEALLAILTTLVVDGNSQHFRLFFARDWTLHGDVVSYGHDIEGSWLMLEAAHALNDAGRIRTCEDLAVRMVEAVLEHGCSADHGVMNEGRAGEIIDSDVHWWPQAEGIVGCVNAYQVTQDTR
ncbi:MAG: AGE family epimerase/isomerase, partial [Firmicutes bacterium]|nr:AGE family epimerase/isomerase [Bacillota bacterium]